MIKSNRPNPRSAGLANAIVVAFLAASGLSAALSDPYPVSNGDMAAIQLNFYAPVAWQIIIEQYDAPIIAIYEKTESKILIDVYGTKDEVKTAQLTMDEFRNRLAMDFIPYFKKISGIELKNEDIKIIYRNRNEEGIKKILIWENGKYKFPIN